MAESRVEDLLETGVEQPVLPMSEIEAILRGEHVTPHSRIAELLLQYNPSDILIEKRITENGTYFATNDDADGYYKVVVDEITPADIHIRCLGVDGGTVTITATDGGTTYTHTASVTLTDETVIFDELEYAGIWTVTNSKDATTATVDNTFIEGNITLMVTKIPLMTSETTPYGECISSSNNWGEGYWRYLPFDGQNGPVSNSGADAWTNQRGDNSPWIGYHFMDSNSNPIKVKMDKVWVQGFCVVWGNSTTRTLYFEGSNDGTNWETIGPGKVFDFGFNTRQSFEHPLNGGKYEYFRIRFDASLNVVDSRWIFIERIQVYANDFAPLPTGALTATENGTYDPEDYDLSAFSEVTVNVPFPQNALLLKDIPSTPTAIATFTDGAEMVMPSLTVGVEAVQEGSGDPSPTNERPIHGRSSANIITCGDSTEIEYFENLSKGIYGVVDLGSLTWSYETTLIEGIEVFQAIISGRAVGTTTLSCPLYANVETRDKLVTNDMTMARLNSSSSAVLIRNDSYTDATAFKTAMSGVKLIYELSEPTEPTVTPSELQAIISSYNITSQITTINLGDTRYGGRLEVVNGVAQFVATHGYVDMGTLNWIYYSAQEVFAVNFADAKPSGRSYGLNALCSNYEVKTNTRYQNLPDKCIMVGSNFYSITSAAIVIRDSAYTDAASFKTAMNGVQLVYELAEPVIIPLGNYPISSLVGENNLFADSGEILEGEYLANPN